MKLIKLPPLSNTPLVSIIVPSYNQGAFIKQTIDSILQQDYRPIEVLVIDGASTDNTLDVLHQYDNVSEVSWISESDSGVIEAVNKGLERAQGEIGGIQSSDDLYIPGSISTAVECMKKNPDVGLAYGDTIKIDADGKELFRSQTQPFSLENFLSKKTWIPQPSAFFRLQLARDLGGWNDKFFNADTEFWLRMIYRIKALKINSFLSKRRVHDGQRNKRAAKIVESYWRMMETSVEVKASPKRLQRAAMCGKYLHAAKYNPTGKTWMQTYYFWRAVLVYPQVLSRLDLPGALVPGYYLMRRSFSKLKRRLQAPNS